MIYKGKTLLKWVRNCFGNYFIFFRFFFFGLEVVLGLSRLLFGETQGWNAGFGWLFRTLGGAFRAVQPPIWGNQWWKVVKCRFRAGWTGKTAAKNIFPVHFCFLCVCTYVCLCACVFVIEYVVSLYFFYCCFVFSFNVLLFLYLQCIIFREADALSVGKYSENNALEQPLASPQDRKHISWKTIVHFLSHRKASLTFLTNNFPYYPLPFI